MRDTSAVKPREDDRLVEAWLRQEFARRFDRTLAEKVPQELLALLPRR